MSETTTAANPLLGSRILDAIKRSGVTFAISVPDITTSEGLLRPLAREQALRHVRVCKEDEGISICAALSYCGHRSIMMMQQTGLYDSVNAIRAIAVEYGHPICMLVGLQGAEARVHPRESPKHIVRVAMPVLDALGVEHHLLVTDGDEAKIPAAIDAAYKTSKPVVFLVGARLLEE